ncbi:hypothetical protein, partial [Serratia marcescens]|uniref:hypothetical protein n=1 Tax=Serratia marcescens TaxID=615 RepID=UPI00066E2FC5
TDYKSVALPTELSRHQVQRILGRAGDLCNKKIALRALSLINQSILHTVMQFAACGVQTFITRGNILYNFIHFLQALSAAFSVSGFSKHLTHAGKL